MKKILLATVLVLVCSLQISCSGDECSATANYIDDIEPDCVDDAEDNCVGVSNIDQADEDEDGIGDACDPDYVPSADISAKSLSRSPVDIATKNTTLSVGTFTLTEAECNVLPKTITLQNQDAQRAEISWRETNKSIVDLPQQNLRCRILWEDGRPILMCLFQYNERNCLGTYEKIF